MSLEQRLKRLEALEERYRYSEDWIRSRTDAELEAILQSVGPVERARLRAMTDEELEAEIKRLSPGRS